MTARTCPVHGEYSADGICRWCEPETEKYSLKSVDALTHQWFIDRTNQAIADLLGPPPKLLPLTHLATPVVIDLNEPEDARASMDEAIARLVTVGYVAVEYRYAEPEHTVAVITADMNAEEESSLLAQHAALRWERVARRWGNKHRLSMLDIATRRHADWGVDIKGAFRILIGILEPRKESFTERMRRLYEESKP